MTYKITKFIIQTLMLLLVSQVQAMNIVTINDDNNECLFKKSEPILLTKEGLAEAKQIAKQLNDTITPLMPAAGLAAPQIGITKQIFIFSWDRSIDHVQVVINPTFTPVGNEVVSSWEACFSAMPAHSHPIAAFLKRYKKIKVTYYDLEGKLHTKILEEFAAKVFQHEYDHLQGIVNIKKEDAQTRIFQSKSEMMDFFTNIKKQDKAHYIEPTNN